jgi:hypothetical protein
MRSRLTTLLVVGFVCAGTGGAMALTGGPGLGLGLGAHGRASASFSQYRPPETPPFPVPPTKGPPETTPPVKTPPVPTPPASRFVPARASTRLSAHGGATVSCPTACRIVLRVRRGSRHVRLTRALHHQGTANLHLSKSALGRLGRGKAVVIVEVNGKVIATRTVRL